MLTGDKIISHWNIWWNCCLYIVAVRWLTLCKNLLRFLWSWPVTSILRWKQNQYGHVIICRIAQLIEAAGCKWSKNNQRGGDLTIIKPSLVTIQHSLPENRFVSHWRLERLCPRLNGAAVRLNGMNPVQRKTQRKDESRVLWKVIPAQTISN